MAPMISALLAALLLAAPDAGSKPKDEPSVDRLVTKIKADVCAKEKGFACDALGAFLRGTPVTVTAPVLSIGKAELVSIRSKKVEKSVAYVLSLQPGENKEPATAAVFGITPEDDKEAADIKAFVAAFAAGKHDQKSELFALRKQGAESQPRYDTEAKDGSLVFEIDEQLGGNWLRRSGNKYVLFGFAGDRHSPAVVIAEMP